MKEKLIAVIKDTQYLKVQTRCIAEMVIARTKHPKLKFYAN